MATLEENVDDKLQASHASYGALLIITRVVLLLTILRIKEESFIFLFTNKATFSMKHVLFS